MTNWILQNLSIDPEGMTQSISSISIHNDNTTLSFQDNSLSERAPSGDPLVNDSKLFKSEYEDQEKKNDDQCKFEEFIANVQIGRAHV